MSVYKGENVIAGGSVDTYFVRKPAWSQAENISLSYATPSYAVPNDGIIVGVLFTGGSTSTGTSILVNGVEVSRNKANDSDKLCSVQCQVNKGDIVTVTGAESSTGSAMKFVPFEDSTVAEPEVVTPEYIRNQNILSDYESITPGTTEGTAFTMPYDGYGYVRWSSGTTRQFNIKRGSEIINFGTSTAPQFGETTGFNFKKGDKLYSETGYAWFKVCYYKLRDYRGR